MASQTKRISLAMKLKRVPLIYGFLLALLCIAYAWRPLEGGFDFWAHAAVGKWIWLNRAIPRETLFLWSEPGTPWVAHSWLSELFFFGLLSAGGPQWVAVFNAAMVTATFFVLWALWKREGTYTFWVPMLFALAIWVSAPRFQPRQELISALFLALLIVFLARCERGCLNGIPRACFWLALAVFAAVFALWVNLHALVAVGLLLLLATFAGNFFQKMTEGKQGSVSQNSPLLLLLIVGIVATFLNPYGWYYWTAAGVLQSGSQAQFVEEWKPMWAAPAMFEYMAAMAVLGTVALLAWRANPQRQWSHFLWLLLAVALTLRSRRMLWLAAILFLGVMAVNARYLDPPTLWRKWRRLIGGDPEEVVPGTLRSIARGGAIVCIAVWVLAAASRHTPQEAGSWNMYVRNVPEGAVQYLAPRAAELRIFNDYEDSSYLQWRLNGALSRTISLQGNLPLYLDLLNAYPDNLLFEYFDILDANATGVQRLEERKIDCIVLGEHHWDKPLVLFLERPGSGWQAVWSDKQSKIWRKSNGE